MNLARKVATDRAYTLRVRDTPHFREQRVSYTRKYSERPEFKEKVRNAVRAWGRKNPEKVRAYHAVKYAVRVGNLVRPISCQGCGEVPEPRIDGRSRIQAHHHRGYENPLDVIWLCSYCHNKEHRRDV